MANVKISELTADSSLDGTEIVPLVDGVTTKRATALALFNLRSATTAPASGTYELGARVWNSEPAAGKPTGWICISAGTPGTWRPMGFVVGASVTVSAATGTIAVTDGPTIADRAGVVALTLPTAAQMVGYEGKEFVTKALSNASETNIVSFAAGSGTTLEYAHTIEAPYGSLTWWLDGTVWRVK